jgi:diguanylate cyclase (GGDEF)-like protein/PAS domain S-box-containing protein
VIEADALSAMLLDVFAFSPVAICISTAGPDARYIKVNDAYLKLVGKNWAQLRNRSMIGTGGAVDSPERNRRQQLLQDVGCYSLEEANIRHAQGRSIPCLISARRTRLHGESYDIELLIDITERVRMQTEIEFFLRRAALTDPLTNLPNRADFDRHLETALRNAAVSDSLVVALAFLDINKFKSVNDNYGHDMGDRLLQRFATRLQASVAPEAFAARLGGDEFAIVYRLERQEAPRLAHNLLKDLNVICRPFDIEGHTLVVGSACGVAFQDMVSETPTTLLKRADANMYAAKAAGEMVSVYCPAPAAAARAVPAKPISRPRMRQAG